jgi:hypothetical protein
MVQLRAYALWVRICNGLDHIHILISLVMFYGGIHLLVRTFTQVKDALFQELFGIIGVGLVLGAVCVFLAGMSMQGT